MVPEVKRAAGTCGTAAFMEYDCLWRHCTLPACIACMQAPFYIFVVQEIVFRQKADFFDDATFYHDTTSGCVFAWQEFFMVQLPGVFFVIVTMRTLSTQPVNFAANEPESLGPLPFFHVQDFWVKHSYGVVFLGNGNEFFEKTGFNFRIVIE